MAMLISCSRGTYLISLRFFLWSAFMLPRFFFPSGQVLLLLSQFTPAFRPSNLGIAFMLPGNFVAADLSPRCLPPFLRHSLSFFKFPNRIIAGSTAETSY